MNRPEAMTPTNRSTGEILARNTLLNLVGQVVPLLVGVVAIPVLIRAIGVERFGLLSLAWLVIGYFTILDLGMGRSATKYISEARGKGSEADIPSILWSAVVIQLAMGIVGAIILYFATPLLVESILKIPPQLQTEARYVFRLLSFGIPVVLLSASFSGALEAMQRFDLLNAVRVPSSVGTYLLPMAGALAGLQLPVLVLSILAIRIGAFLAFMCLSLKILPDIKTFRGRLSIMPAMFKFGGWITVSNVINPFLLNFDRFLITSMVSVAALSYYVAPSEALGRLAIIPASLTMSLFPAFGTLSGQGNRGLIERVFFRSMKFEVLIIGPIVLSLVVFAEGILQIWLGGQFSVESSAVLRILGLGVFVNSMAIIPYTLLQSTGRPDLTAKFHLIELGIYLILAYLLIRRWSIDGAASAWTFRVALDAVLLFAASSRVFRFDKRAVKDSGLGKAMLGVTVLAAAAFGMKVLLREMSFPLLAIPYVAMLCLFYIWTWKVVLDRQDHGVIGRIMTLAPGVDR